MKRKLPVFFKKTFFSKRQRFVTGVVFLSLSLFLIEHFMGKSGIFFVILIAALSDAFLYWALHRDLKENFSPQVFMLPFFYTLALGLFYLLVPQRILIKLILTLVYALGIYSVFLSQNIFTVSSIRTIALLSSARTVSFVITLFSYFFLATVIFSLHLNIFITLILIAFSSIHLVIHSIWTYALDKNLKETVPWGIMLTICLTEVSLLLWFWPSTPTIISLFLTGVFYIVVGLSHLWFERRLFKGVILEYIWVAFVVFTVLALFTSWT